MALSLALQNSSYKTTKLETLLRDFTRPEKLDDGIKCGKCGKESTQSVLQAALWKLPPVLIINLKRFKITRWGREKLLDNVSVPKDLDVKSYLLETSKRALF